MTEEFIKAAAQFGPFWVILALALVWAAKFFSEKWWPYFQERTKIIDAANIDRAKEEAAERRARELADREERQKLLEVIENNTEIVQHNSAVSARLEQTVSMLNTKIQDLQDKIEEIDSRTREAQG